MVLAGHRESACRGTRPATRHPRRGWPADRVGAVLRRRSRRRPVGPRCGGSSCDATLASTRCATTKRCCCRLGYSDFRRVATGARHPDPDVDLRPRDPLDDDRVRTIVGTTDRRHSDFDAASVIGGGQFSAMISYAQPMASATAPHPPPLPDLVHLRRHRGVEQGRRHALVVRLHPVPSASQCEDVNVGGLNRTHRVA